MPAAAASPTIRANSSTSRATPPDAQDQSQSSGSETQTSNPEKALPAPGESDQVVTLDVGGDGTTVKLGALGPLVVNQDGTMSRISNWAEMSAIERENTLRVLGKRNKARLAALREAKEKDSGSTQSEQ